MVARIGEGLIRIEMSTRGMRTFIGDLHWQFPPTMQFAQPTRTHPQPNSGMVYAGGLWKIYLIGIDFRMKVGENYKVNHGTKL
jgi:hypothetical protein